MKNYNQKIGDLGQYWTPHNVVLKMSSLIKNNGSILEPCAGTGRFVKHLMNCVAIEIDKSVIPNKFKKQYVIQNFFNYPISNKFDTIISNPPYVEGRLLTDEWFSTWKGKLPRTANGYLHFIEKSLKHLNKNGELIFIVPAAFFSGTSLGKNLRKKMIAHGAFTDIIFSQELSIIWENALIDTVIFRWKKGLKQDKTIIIDNSKKILFEKNGFIWFVDFIPKAVIGDYFKATVGSAPYKKDVVNGKYSNNFGEYTCEGKFIKICEKNIHNWPRVRNTPKINKIFFIGGPTRRWPVFFSGNNQKHLDYALLPKQQINTKQVAESLNIWFKQMGKSLGIISGGRWSVGIKQIESCPIDKKLFNILERLKFI